LLRYEQGWEPIPTDIERWAFASDANMNWPGAVVPYHIQFGWRLQGELPNGRYKFKREHWEDHLRPGVPQRQEMLLVEFIVDDNTPSVLGDIEPHGEDISLSVSDVTPTGLRLAITNHTGYAFVYNSPFILEKYVYGVWSAIYAVNQLTRRYYLMPEDTTVYVTATWGAQYGWLPAGVYRLTAHFAADHGGRVVTYDFIIPDVPNPNNTPLNPMFEKPVIVTDVTVTPTGLVIRWENVSDCVFYTPWTGYWIERYTPGEPRDWRRVREGSDSVFSGPNVNLRQVTLELESGGSLTFDTTPLHPGEHVYQTINWRGAIPAGQYVASLAHFHPDEPGFMYWIRAWERFSLLFTVDTDS